MVGCFSLFEKDLKSGNSAVLGCASKFFEPCRSRERATESANETASSNCGHGGEISAEYEASNKNGERLKPTNHSNDLYIYIYIYMYVCIYIHVI